MKDPLRLLFCLPTTALSGGVKVIFDLAEGLAARGHTVDVFSFAGPPRWRAVGVSMHPSRDTHDIDGRQYDIVFAGTAAMLPLLIPQAAPARVAFYAQDYESFHYGTGNDYASFMAEAPVLRDLYRLPVPIVTDSLAAQRLIRERAGRDAWFAPVGLRKDVFRPQPSHARGAVARVLFVGNYLMPYKGMLDGLAALRLLSETIEVELVLATQEVRGRALFDAYPFRKEIHLRPPESAMPAIYASTDVYCCTSWYEGLGLPALEAFCCGVPVVSTRTHGVDEYGVDGVNLLLANAHDPADLVDKLRRILTDEALATCLRDGGWATVRDRYDWSEGITAFERALGAIVATDVPAIDPAHLSDLLTRLDNEGALTPVETFRRYDALSRALDDTCEALTRQADAASVRRLQAIRDELRPFVGNPRAQYYRAFRAAFDRCQLLLSLAPRADFPTLAATLLARRRAHMTHASPTLDEVRYS